MNKPFYCFLEGLAYYQDSQLMEDTQVTGIERPGEEETQIFEEKDAFVIICFV